MGILKKLFFSEQTKEEKKQEEKIEKDLDKYSGALVENDFTCNSCGKTIEGTPRFMNHCGRKMIFHKRCLRKLKKGNI